jgi:hypothetical protein
MQYDEEQRRDYVTRAFCSFVREFHHILWFLKFMDAPADKLSYVRRFITLLQPLNRAASETGTSNGSVATSGALISLFDADAMPRRVSL